MSEKILHIGTFNIDRDPRGVIADIDDACARLGYKRIGRPMFDSAYRRDSGTFINWAREVSVRVRKPRPVPRIRLRVR